MLIFRAWATCAQIRHNIKGPDYADYASRIPHIMKKGERRRLEFAYFQSLSPKNVKLGNFTSNSCSDGKEIYQQVSCSCTVVVLHGVILLNQ